MNYEIDSLDDALAYSNRLKVALWNAAESALAKGETRLAARLKESHSVIRYATVCMCTDLRRQEAIAVLEQAANRDEPGRPGYWSRLWAAILGR